MTRTHSKVTFQPIERLCFFNNLAIAANQHIFHSDLKRNFDPLNTFKCQTCEYECMNMNHSGFVENVWEEKN